MNADASRHVLTEEEAKQLDQECMQRFLKMNCKIVTRSKGIYEGVLIITPSAIMFDPIDMHQSSSAKSAAKREHSSHGSGSGVVSTIYDEASAIIPVELISNVIMYEDLAITDVEEYFEYQQQQA